ncbi:SDR family oxidoreductase [Nocardia sp. NPDC049190]|uniref:SDR family oxidoreductase n=1 Tax=Nocardia sp. NPDC049190 TaxID=3155650 RepID=UPI00340C8448
MTSPQFTGKVAIVTGASRGIGLAAGQALATGGANVVVTARALESATAAAGEIGSSAVGFAAHAADENSARECIDFVGRRFGRIDILVNNAGTNPAFGPIIDQDHTRFAKLFDINLWAPILWTRLAAAAWMREHGGVVINTASINGMSVSADLGLYNVSKAALIHLTKQLALELSPRIRVNAVAPGVVRTKLAEALWKDHEAEVAASTPLERLGEPDDIGSAIAFMASDAASWITGETLVIDGGQLLTYTAEPRTKADR